LFVLTLIKTTILNLDITALFIINRPQRARRYMQHPEKDYRFFMFSPIKMETVTRTSPAKIISKKF